MALISQSAVFFCNIHYTIILATCTQIFIDCYIILYYIILYIHTYTFFNNSLYVLAGYKSIPTQVKEFALLVNIDFIKALKMLQSKDFLIMNTTQKIIIFIYIFIKYCLEQKLQNYFKPFY